MSRYWLVHMYTLYYDFLKHIVFVCLICTLYYDFLEDIVFGLLFGHFDIRCETYLMHLGI